MERYKTRNLQESDRTAYSTTGQNIDRTENRDGKKNKRRNFLTRPDYLLRYDVGSLSPDFSSEARIRSSGLAVDGQRIFSDPSICRYSLPLGFSLEPVSLPVYPALFRSPSDLDPSTSPQFDRTKRKKTRRKRESRKNVETANDSPDTFRHSEQKDSEHQDFASLPPADRDPRFHRPADNENPINKRRFSDPGLGQASSEDGSSSMCSVSSTGSSDSQDECHNFYSLYKKLNEIKKVNCQLSKELYETKIELESLKVFCESCGTGSTGLSPGKLADAISEVRDAAKMREEALIAKVISMVEENSGKCKEVHRNLEEKLKFSDTEERFKKIEEKLENLLSGKDEKTREPQPSSNRSTGEEAESSFRSRVLHLEKEKSELRKELEEAIAGRKKAEENTRRLERLVGILRKKINGVSSETCAYEEKPPSTSRSVSSVLERNPFIIANNKSCLESDSFPNRKKFFPWKKEEEGEIDVKENGESSSTDDGGSSSVDTPPVLSPTETSSLSAQVTITGPVTDL